MLSFSTLTFSQIGYISGIPYAVFIMITIPVSFTAQRLVNRGTISAPFQRKSCIAFGCIGSGNVPRLGFELDLNDFLLLLFPQV